MIPLPAFRRLSWLWLPVLLVLLARTAIAPGWMVERDAGGAITVRVCSDVNSPGQSVEIPFERSGDHDSAKEQHCAWGALAGAAPLPEAPRLDAAAITLAAIPAPPRAQGFAPGAASPLPPSTGPPALT